MDWLTAGPPDVGPYIRWAVSLALAGVNALGWWWAWGAGVEAIFGWKDEGENAVAPGAIIPCPAWRCCCCTGKTSLGSPPYKKRARVAHSATWLSWTACEHAKTRQAQAAWISECRVKKDLTTSLSGPWFSTSNCRRWSTGRSFETMCVPWKHNQNKFGLW